MVEPAVEQFGNRTTIVGFTPSSVEVADALVKSIERFWWFSGALSPKPLDFELVKNMRAIAGCCWPRAIWHVGSSLRRIDLLPIPSGRRAAGREYFSDQGGADGRIVASIGRKEGQALGPQGKEDSPLASAEAQTAAKRVDSCIQWRPVVESSVS